MKLERFLKDKIILIIILIFNYFILFNLLYGFKVDISLITSFSFIFITMSILIILLDYFRKKIFYSEFINSLEELDKKYLILETLPMPSFYEGELLYQTLYDINKSMLEEVNNYSNNINDFKDYVEMWIHEVKIPISSLVLMCHNNKNNIDKKYLEQVRKLDNYIDQVLYYVRSNYTEQDFIFKEVKLDKIVSDVLLKNKDDLLENNIEIEVNLREISIMTDPKWLEFILNQIINNSIKYKDSKKDNSFIKINAVDKNSYVSLFIYDNGIGIKESDIKKVFNKSFTGENGRLKTKSTGMGLYIAKKLCTKLGHSISIKSNYNKNTTVEIKIGKNDFYKNI